MIAILTQMKTIKLFLILVLLVTVATIILRHSNNPDAEELILPQEVTSIYKVHNKIYAPNDPVIKVVTYFKNTAAGELKKWIPYIDKYPEIDFLFYCTDQEYQNLPVYLESINFPANIYTVADKDRKDNGYLLICYVVNKDNKIVEVTNPTIPDFDDLLRKLK